MNPTLAILLPLALSILLPAQGLSLTVRDGVGGLAGGICGPWSCIPSPLTVPAGTNLSIEIGAPWYTPHFLMVALPPSQCAVIPGFGGSLIVQPPVVSLLMAPTSLTRYYISWGPGPHPHCTTFTSWSALQLPPNLPSGAQLLLQAVGPDFWIAPDPFAFSNAVMVNIL